MPRARIRRAAAVLLPGCVGGCALLAPLEEHHEVPGAAVGADAGAADAGAADVLADGGAPGGDGATGVPCSAALCEDWESRSSVAGSGWSPSSDNQGDPRIDLAFGHLSPRSFMAAFPKIEIGKGAHAILSKPIVTTPTSRRLIVRAAVYYGAQEPAGFLGVEIGGKRLELARNSDSVLNSYIGAAFQAGVPFSPSPPIGSWFDVDMTLEFSPSARTRVTISYEGAAHLIEQEVDFPVGPAFVLVGGVGRPNSGPWAVHVDDIVVDVQ